MRRGRSRSIMGLVVVLVLSAGMAVSSALAETIYVKEGGTGSRYQTFQMINGVAIYGGFATTSNPAREDRDPDTYLTILSGDLNGDDDSGGDDSDNCYHVFYHPDGTNLDTTAILDGVSITAGNADNTDWPYSHFHGGGRISLNWFNATLFAN